MPVWQWQLMIALQMRMWVAKLAPTSWRCAAIAHGSGRQTIAWRKNSNATGNASKNANAGTKEPWIPASMLTQQSSCSLMEEVLVLGTKDCKFESCHNDFAPDGNVGTAKELRGVSVAGC